MDKTNKKLALLYILQILQKNSDAEHRLTQESIRQKLKSDYGIDIERRAVGRNIELLKQAGYDIVTNHAAGTYIAEQKFTDGELRFLIDTVLFSPFIQKRYAQDLMDKLASFGSVSFDGVVNTISVEETFHERNADMFDNIELLSQAIKDGKKVTLSYLEYDFEPQKGVSLIKSDYNQNVVFNPYKMITHRGFYYLFGSYIDDGGYMDALRIDRIMDLRITEQPVSGFSQSALADKKIAEYIFAHPYLYGGKPERIEMRISSALIDDLVNTFGKNIEISETDDYDCIVRVTAGLNDTIEWVMLHPYGAEVLSPEFLRYRIMRRAKCLASVHRLSVTEYESGDNPYIPEYPYNLMEAIFGTFGNDNYGDKSECIKVLNELMKDFSDEQKNVITKKYMRGKSFADGARELGISEDDFERTLCSCLRFLRHPRRSKYLKEFMG